MKNRIIIGNAYSTLDCDDVNIVNMVDDTLSVKQPGYFFSPAFKSGMWDGRIRFLNRKTNTFPSGHVEEIVKLFETEKIECEIIDDRQGYQIDVPESITLREPDAEHGVITLRDYQQEAVENAINNYNGVVNVATNGGKTEIAAGIIKQILPKLEDGETILFVTHSKEIFHQSAERLERRLNVSVGKVGDGSWDVKPVTLVMVPTVSRYIKKPTTKSVSYTKDMKSINLIIKLLDGELAKGLNNRKIMMNAIAALEDVKDEKQYDEKAVEILSVIVQNQPTSEGCYQEFLGLKKDLKDYQVKKMKDIQAKHDRVIELLRSARCFIGDEVHHASSTSWYDTLMLCENATYRIGLTGTVDRKDEVNVMRLFGSVGGILTRITNDFLINRGISAKPTLYLTPIHEPVIAKEETWQSAYKFGIVENKTRNELVATQVEERYNEGDGCLVIVNQVAHGEILYEMLQERGVECEFTHGNFSGRERVLDELRDGTLKVLIATSILDEGVDVSNINSLWLASGGKSYRQVLQRIGRGLRKKSDGSGIRVYDYLDYTHMYLTKHSSERYQYYKAEKFDVKKLNE